MQASLRCFNSDSREQSLNFAMTAVNFQSSKDFATFYYWTLGKFMGAHYCQ
jgi:hypothetical protein